MGALLRVIGMVIGVNGLLTAVNGFVDEGLGDVVSPAEVAFGLVFLAIGVYSFLAGLREDKRH